MSRHYINRPWTFFNPGRALGILAKGLALVLTVLMVLPGAVRADDDDDDDDDGDDVYEFERAPYVQKGTAFSMHVVFRTEGLIEPIVKYGRSPKRLKETVPPDNIVVKVGKLDKDDRKNPDREEREILRAGYDKLLKLHSASSGLVQYEVEIKDLDQDTRYYYGVFDGDARLTPEDPSYTFVTHPRPGKRKPLRVWVIGDSGTGKDPQKEVHEAMVDWVKDHDRPINLFLHVGDMAYGSGTDKEFQKKFFDIYEPTLRHTVCWPAMGNHEGATSKGKEGIGPYYDAYVLPTRGEAGGLASGSEAYYSYDHGHVHFIVLDSHDLDRKPTGAMARWLKADLDRTRAEWIIAYWHHPPYTKGSHDSDKEKQLIEMRTHIMPILESGGVDLVVTGHSHIYERSMLMDGAYATPTVAEYVILDDRDGDPDGEGAYRKSAGLQPNQGTIQVVAGHGGTGLKRKGTMPVMKRVIVEHGSLILEFNKDKMTGLMLNSKGVQRDQFQVVKKGKVTPQRLANPRQLPEYHEPRKESKDGAVDPPKEYEPLIAKNSEWLYLAGSHAKPGWTDPGYKAAGWKIGKADFGYDKDRVHQTELKDMKGRYKVVYLRRVFIMDQPESVAELGLMVDYDDGFIAYLNGKEILRKNVDEGRGKDADGVEAHSADGYRYYEIKDPQDLLQKGPNLLAIEGHNRSRDSSDFTLDPYLIVVD